LLPCAAMRIALAILLIGSAASAQTPAEPGLPPVGQAATPAGQAEGRLLLGLSGLGGVSDESETSASRFGGFGLEAGWHFTPDWAALASMDETFASQPYLGIASGETAVDETRTDLRAVVDWRIKDRLWEIVTAHVFLGPRFLLLRNDVVRPWMGSALLGTRIEMLLHDELVADVHYGWAHALFGKKDDASALGGFKTTHLYGAGLALRLAPTYRVRIGYRGETWVMERTDRVIHGVEVGLEIRTF
jgi:hypothetical protein